MKIHIYPSIRYNQKIFAMYKLKNHSVNFSLLKPYEICINIQMKFAYSSCSFVSSFSYLSKCTCLHFSPPFCFYLPKLLRSRSSFILDPVSILPTGLMISSSTIPFPLISSSFQNTTWRSKSYANLSNPKISSFTDEGLVEKSAGIPMYAGLDFHKNIRIMMESFFLHFRARDSITRSNFSNQTCMYSENFTISTSSSRRVV